MNTGKVVNLRCLPIIPVKAFIALWCQAAKQGRTLHQLSSRLGRRIQSVRARADSLILLGVSLPPLELGQEPDIMEELQRLFTEADIADGLIPS